MKIAHVTEGWTGGISTYIETLIDGQNLSHNISEIVLIYSKNKTNDDLVDKFKNHKKIILCSYTSSRNPFKFYQIAKNIDKILAINNPDIIHLHSTFPGVYGRLIKKKPIIYCAHGWAFLQDIGLLRKYLYIIIEKILATRTDIIINISNNEDKEAKKYGIKAKINTVILNGVRDVIKSQAVSHPHLEEKIINNKNKKLINIGFIGRLDHQKGFDIIEPIFRTIGNNIHLYVIGAADRNNDKIYQQCKNITYLGWVDNQIIDSYIQQFDAVIIPSRYEGFGLVAIEIMRNEKAIIVSNRGALPELITDKSGYIFDLDNLEQLKNILHKLNKNELIEMGKNARSVYLENFTETKFINKIEKLYLKLMSDSSK